MNLQRWRQIDELFQAVVEMDPAQRASFLEEACSGNSALRSEVEAMLASDSDGWDFVEKPALQVAAPLLVEEQPQLAPGDTISHYRVVVAIGRGGMGEVYLAEDERLGRKVALKLLTSDFTSDPSRMRRFQQEARTASALNHPNILTIHDIGESGGQYFIASEFIDGETLRQRLSRQRMTITEALDITIQIASALVVAHEAGIVHRDIKPENLMLRRDGYVKVLDFGLAKLAGQDEPTTDAATDKSDISSGLVMGTVKYMSPEQARGLEVDARSDIFSFGVVLYEMVTGRAPFKGEAANQLVRSILNDEPPSLTEDAPDAPEELQGIINKALSKNKAERYQSTEDLLVDLKTLRHHLEIAKGSQPVLRKLEGGASSSRDKGARAAWTLGYFVNQIKEHKPIAAVGLVSLVILLAGVGYPLMKWINKRAAPSEKLKLTMLTTTGNVYDVAISPDGKYMAYAAFDADLFSLRVRELATSEEMQIVPPGKRLLGQPSFSADSKYLYYVYQNDDVPNTFIFFTLYRRPVLGGAAEKMAAHLPRWVALSPDGKKIAFVRQDASAGLSTLVIANVDGAEERSLMARKAPDYFSTNGVSWATDGKHIAYVAKNASDGYERIFEVNLETQVERPLTSQKWDYPIEKVAWLPDTTGILFTASNNTISNAIWGVSYPGGDLQRVITNDTNRYLGLSVASDSNRLVTIQIANYNDLWLAPDADASRARRIMPGRLDGGGDWTPDGKIVFTRGETNGNTDIWITNADGTNQKRLTSDVHQNDWSTVTSDGRYIVFRSNRTGTNHIWRMDIDGGNLKQLTFGSGEHDPQCSPDSKWVVYHTQETGKDAIWKIPVEGGTPQQFTDVVCVWPRISHDGKLIACTSSNSYRRVLIFSFEGGQPLATLELPLENTATGCVGWTFDDRAIMYGKFTGGIGNYWIMPLDGSPTKQLTFFKPDQLAASPSIGIRPAWSPDGRNLLFGHYERKSDAFMLSGLK